MNRQKIGITLFWIGVIGVIVMQALTWIQNPAQRVHTADELNGTVNAIWGTLFWIRNLGGWGLTLSLIGVLVYASKKGSYFWLLGFLPGAALGAAMLWEPSQYLPILFGTGGTVILLSYFGILWLWTRTYTAYEGLARTGRHIQLLGYSFLVSTGLMLCLYFGNPSVLALADLPIPSPESINLTLSFSMLLLFVGQYVVARSKQESAATLQEALQSQPSAADLMKGVIIKILATILSGLSLLMGVLLIIRTKNPIGRIFLAPKSTAGALSPYWAIAVGAFIGRVDKALWAVPMCC